MAGGFEEYKLHSLNLSTRYMFTSSFSFEISENGSKNDKFWKT